MIWPIDSFRLRLMRLIASYGLVFVLWQPVVIAATIEEREAATAYLNLVEALTSHDEAKVVTELDRLRGLGNRADAPERNRVLLALGLSRMIECFVGKRDLSKALVAFKELSELAGKPYSHVYVKALYLANEILLHMLLRAGGPERGADGRGV